jgi:D-alanyl-D-alanine carboxypeptidase
VRLSAVLVLALALPAFHAAAGETPPEILKRAYSDAIARTDGNAIVFMDGLRLDAGADDPAKSFDERIAHADLRDMFRLAYPKGAALAAPARDFDPGRFRDKAFFDHLYGDCRKGQVEKRLVSVTWLPKTWGRAVKFAPEAAAALGAVSNEIDAMPQAIRRAAYPTAGTYACRGVADKGQPSMHAYGAAIDLNLDVSNYWLWDGHGKGAPVWRNRMPREIVDAFERHGFIWGGRWYHYDTMHFEYRPELAAATR